MAWCRQTTSHYLSKRRPGSICHMSSLGHYALISALEGSTHLRLMTHINVCIVCHHWLSLPFRHHIITLTHWSWVTHICISKLTSVGSDNGLSPGRRQAIIWTNAGILLIGPVGTNFREILIFSFKKMHFKMPSGKWRPFCLGINMLTNTEILSIGTVANFIETRKKKNEGSICPGPVGKRVIMIMIINDLMIIIIIIMIMITMTITMMMKAIYVVGNLQIVISRAGCVEFIFFKEELS